MEKYITIKNYETRHIMIHLNKVYETKTVVDKTFGYILCTIMKTYLWLTI